MQSGDTYSPGLTGFGASGEIIILPGGPSADNLWKLYVREFMLYIISDHTAVMLSEVAPTPTSTQSGAALLSIYVGMNYYWFYSSCFPFLLFQLYYIEKVRILSFIYKLYKLFVNNLAVEAQSQNRDSKCKEPH